MDTLKKKEISAVFHYVPLHSSPLGLNLGNRKDDLPVTEDLNVRLLRLPMYAGLTSSKIQSITEKIQKILLD
jgi:dTDP-4-amino-4,6-dideoxygalactose transaminase